MTRTELAHVTLNDFSLAALLGFFKPTVIKKNMLFLIGLGLCDADDITMKGLKIVQRCYKVYLETYTSIMSSTIQELEETFNKKLIEADRCMIEEHCDEILTEAKENDVAILVVGDVLSATTHTDLIVRAASSGINYKIIHNASVVNAVMDCGLQFYNFGETVSIPFWTDEWRPKSFMDKIISNLRNGLHTLCLLDIRVKEMDWNVYIKTGKIVYEPKRFMTVKIAISQIRQCLNDDINSQQYLSDDSICIGVARLGHDSQKIVVNTLKELENEDFGEPLHSLLIPGRLHDVEIKMMCLFSNDVIKNILTKRK